MRTRGRSSGIRLAGLALLCTSLASGCASLQQSGPVTKVPEQDAGASQVQLWPSPPSGRESPAEIVNGFLDAARSGVSNQGIANDYLTPAMQKQWRSEQNTVVVLADFSLGTPQSPASGGQQGLNSQAEDADAGANPGPDGSDASDSSAPAEVVQGTVLGQLNANGVYAADSHSTSFEFHLQQTSAGFRISSLPTTGFGVLMERSDFETFYSRHVVYYQNPQESGDLVPTQVYLPTVDGDQQVTDQVAKLVVDGVPDPALSPALQAAMTGASFLKLQVGNDSTATVTIKANGACGKSIGPCDQLAQQLAQTLGGLSAKVTSVIVADQSSGRVTPPYPSSLGESDYGLGSQLRPQGNQQFYAISPTNTLESLDTSGAPAVPIGFGTAKTRFHAVAARPDGAGVTGLALVSQDQSTVYIPHRQNGVMQLATVYPTTGAPVGGHVGFVGWDDFETLWFTVTLNGDTSVYRYAQGSVSQVTVTGLAGATLDEVMPAPDGDRVAVRYTDEDGDQSIVIAAVTQSASGDYALNLGDPEVVASSWNSITGFDWYNENSLAVLGMQPSSQELGLYQIYADGSAVYDSLTSQPVQASPPSQASGFVWTAAGQPIATSVNAGKATLYTLSVEGEDAQQLNTLTGSSPTY